MDINEIQLNNYSNSEPYVGMPIEWLHVDKLDDVKTKVEDTTCFEVDSCPLAMAYVPWQRWCKTYDPETAFDRGTIFPELDLPFLGGGTR